MNQFDNFNQNPVSPDSGAKANQEHQDTQAKERNKRLFKRGCQWMGLGVFILGLSFSITFMLFQSDKSFIVIMYILTSLGAACAIKGMVDIFG